VQNIRTAGYLNGKRAVNLIVFRQPAPTSLIRLIPSKRRSSIKASIPQGIDITVVQDEQPRSVHL